MPKSPNGQSRQLPTGGDPLYPVRSPNEGNPTANWSRIAAVFSIDIVRQMATHYKIAATTFGKDALIFKLKSQLFQILLQICCIPQNDLF